MSDQLVLTSPEPRSLTPLELIELAVKNNAAIDVIERLAALQKDFQAREAELHFNDAMTRVQCDIPRIAPNLTNPQTHSDYASYAQIDRVVRPIYAREGFSLSFDTEPSPLAEHVRVLCYVSRGGHTRQYKTDMPADGKGAKGGDVMTKTHAAGAAMSYGMRYLLKMIFNIPIGPDDDGNGVNGGVTKTFDDLRERLDFIASARNGEELDKLFKRAYQDASGDPRAQQSLIAAKDKRRRELSGRVA